MNKWIFLIAALGTSSFAVAGPHVVGNGGISIVCRDPSNKSIIEAHLLDLFEAESLGQSILRKNLDPQVQVSEAIDRLKETAGISYELQRVLHEIQSNTVFIKDPGVGLPLSDDALPFLYKKGCNYEQVALYDSVTEKLMIDSEIYDSAFFSSTDRAALWLHEAIYKLDRLLKNAKDSRESRILTAQLFTEAPSENLIESFNQRFQRYVLKPGEKVLWLDLNQDMRADVTMTNGPSSSTCSFSSFEVGDTNFEALPGTSKYEKVLSIPQFGRGNIGLWMNGSQFRPYMQCASTFEDQQESKKMIAEVIFSQNGKQVLKVLYRNFKTGIASTLLSTYEAEINGEEMDAITIRFL